MAKLKKDELLKKLRFGGFDSLSQSEWFRIPGSGGKKFTADAGQALGITPLGKLVARNANRSVIKKVRQKAKKEINKEIEWGNNDEADRSGNDILFE